MIGLGAWHVHRLRSTSEEEGSPAGRTAFLAWLAVILGATNLLLIVFEGSYVFLIDRHALSAFASSHSARRSSRLPLRRRRSSTRRQTATSLRTWSSTCFSSLVAAPLFAAGHPFRRLGGLWSGPRLGAGLTITVAGVVQVGVLVGWHLPALYDAALENENIHGFEHLTLLATAVFLWWSLGRLSGEAAGAGVFALFVVTLPAMALGVAMTLARTPWYAAYAAEDPHALADQQLAGVVMWAYAGLAAFVGAVVITLGWLNQLERAHPAVTVALGPARADSC